MALEISALALSLSMAAAAGLLGCVAVMRKMTLAADAISHIALPGIGIALALRLHPLVGAGAMLLAGIVLIWAVEIRARLSTETVIGVVFSAALAVGSMITSGEELIEALFGGTGRAAPWEVIFGLLAAAAVIAFVLAVKNRLVVSLVSRDIAHTLGIRVARLELAHLLAFAVTVALGLRFLGVLLMGSLIIIPAATAKRLARNLDGMLAIAVAVAMASTMLGMVLAATLRRDPGPLVVAVAAMFFFLSLLRHTRA